MSRAARLRFVRRTLKGVGLVAAAAGLSAVAAAQPARTGWEDVRPTGWPAQASTAKAPTEVAVATPPRARRGGSKNPRRRVRAAGARRAAPPAWIRLEWDTPPPIDIALDWRRPMLPSTPVAMVTPSPEGPAPFVFALTPAPAADAASVADEARLPVATMIQAAVPAPATPRAMSPFAPAHALAPPTSVFRGFVTRVASALGMRRAAVADSGARVASAEGAGTR